MAVDYSTKGDSFVPDKLRLWAATSFAATRFLTSMDIHPDRKRFLTVGQEEGNGTKYPVSAVLNVFDALRRALVRSCFGLGRGGRFPALEEFRKWHGTLGSGCQRGLDGSLVVADSFPFCRSA